jgi:hypothetical protein
LAAGLLAAGVAFTTFAGFFAGLLAGFACLFAGFFAALAGFDVLLATAFDFFAGALRAAGLADLPEGLRFRDVAIAAFLMLFVADSALPSLWRAEPIGTIPWAAAANYKLRPST